MQIPHYLGSVWEIETIKKLFSHPGSSVLSHVLCMIAFCIFSH